MAGNERIDLDENKIIQYYNDGMTYKAMAEKEGISESKIQRVISKLKRRGKIGNRAGIKYNPNPKINLDINEIIELFKSGMSHKKISEMYNVSERTIRKNITEWFEDNSTMEQYDAIVMKNRTAAVNQSKANLPREELLAMVEKGMSNRAIGRYFNVAHSTVAKELERIKEEKYVTSSN